MAWHATIIFAVLVFKNEYILLTSIQDDEQLSLLPSVYMHDDDGEPPAPPPSEASLVHNGVTCDGCGMNPLRGIRYKVPFIVNPNVIVSVWFSYALSHFI